MNPMKELLKSQRGLSLPMVLMILVILALFSTVIISLGTTDTLHASKQSQKLQAYYLARSGADAVASYFVNNPDKLNSSELKAKIDAIVASGESSEFKLSPSDRGSIKVKVERDGNNLLITSTASLDGIEEVVILRVDMDSSLASPLDKAIYATGDIRIESIVIGDVAALGKVQKEGDGKIMDGEIYIRPGASPAVVEGFTNAIVELTDTFDFPEFPFPDFPVCPTLSNVVTAPLNIVSNSSPIATINTSTYYAGGIGITEAGALQILRGDEHLIIRTPKLHLSGGGKLEDSCSGSGNLFIFADELFIGDDRRFNITLGDGDVNIIVKKATIRGHIKVSRSPTATGKLNIYISDVFDIGSGSSINEGNDPKYANIYFAGSKDAYGNDIVNSNYLRIPDGIKISALLQIKQARLLIENGSGFIGNIISGGNEVTFMRGTSADVKAIYAPKAFVQLSNGAKITGIVISESSYIKDGSELIYNELKPEDLDFFGRVINKLSYKYGIWK